MMHHKNDAPPADALFTPNCGFIDNDRLYNGYLPDLCMRVELLYDCQVSSGRQMNLGWLFSYADPFPSAD